MYPVIVVSVFIHKVFSLGFVGSAPPPLQSLMDWSLRHFQIKNALAIYTITPICTVIATSGLVSKHENVIEFVPVVAWSTHAQASFSTKAVESSAEYDGAIIGVMEDVMP